MMEWNAEKAKELRKQGMSLKELGEMFGVNPETVHCRIDPIYAEHRRVRVNANRRDRSGYASVGPRGYVKHLRPVDTPDPEPITGYFIEREGMRVSLPWISIQHR